MRNQRAGALLSSFFYSFPMTLAVLGFLTACVSAPDRHDWIRIGVTTKDEVLTRYGQPDLLIASTGGDIAVYRPIASAPRLEIPTAQVGPSGTAVTSMQRIDPGLGTKDLNREKKEQLRDEIRIHYDTQGIVRELSSP